MYSFHLPVPVKWHLLVFRMNFSVSNGSKQFLESSDDVSGCIIINFRAGPGKRTQLNGNYIKSILAIPIIHTYF